MKIYNYKTGKAVFVNNEKIEISNKVAEILENYTMFPENMYQDLGIEKRPFVQDKDGDVLKMAESTEVENFESNGENNFNVTFMLLCSFISTRCSLICRWKDFNWLSILDDTSFINSNISLIGTS